MNQIEFFREFQNCETKSKRLTEIEIFEILNRNRNLFHNFDRNRDFLNFDVKSKFFRKCWPKSKCFRKCWPKSIIFRKCWPKSSSLKVWTKSNFFENFKIVKRNRNLFGNFERNRKFQILNRNQFFFVNVYQ